MMQEEELSAKEVKILQLLADGKTARDAAQELHLTDGTIRQYAIRIREKTGSPTTMNAMATALRRGLID